MVQEQGCPCSEDIWITSSVTIKLLEEMAINERTYRIDGSMSAREQTRQDFQDSAFSPAFGNAVILQIWWGDTWVSLLLVLQLRSEDARILRYSIVKAQYLIRLRGRRYTMNAIWCKNLPSILMHCCKDLAICIHLCVDICGGICHREGMINFCATDKM